MNDNDIIKIMQMLGEVVIEWNESNVKVGLLKEKPKITYFTTLDVKLKMDLLIVLINKIHYKNHSFYYSFLILKLKLFSIHKTNRNFTFNKINFT